MPCDYGRPLNDVCQFCFLINMWSSLICLEFAFSVRKEGWTMLSSGCQYDSKARTRIFDGGVPKYGLNPMCGNQKFSLRSGVFVPVARLNSRCM